MGLAAGPGAPYQGEPAIDICTGANRDGLVFDFACGGRGLRAAARSCGSSLEENGARHMRRRARVEVYAPPGPWG